MVQQPMRSLTLDDRCASRSVDNDAGTLARIGLLHSDMEALIFEH